MSGGRPFAAAPDGARIAVHVTPRAGRNRVDGIAADAAGRAVVRLSVTAPPDQGKANAAAVALVAKALGVPKSRLSVAAGKAARRKTLHLSGAPAAVIAALVQWAEGLDG